MTIFLIVRIDLLLERLCGLINPSQHTRLDTQRDGGNDDESRHHIEQSGLVHDQPPRN